MQILNKIIEYLPFIFEKLFQLISGNIENARKENWFNPEENYPEKSSLENSNEDEIEDPVTAIIFNSPVEMDIPFVTSKHGYRTLRGKKVWHSGVDFRAAEGSSCKAVEDGLIVEMVKLKKSAPCRFAWKNGKWVDLHNGSITPRIVVRGKYTGNLYFYKHAVANTGFRPGIAIRSGQIMGIYGNYGYSMGSHCHFEYWTPRKPSVKYTQDYRKDFKQRDPVSMMRSKFGMSFTGRT